MDPLQACAVLGHLARVIHCAPAASVDLTRPQAQKVKERLGNPRRTCDTVQACECVETALQKESRMRHAVAGVWRDSGNADAFEGGVAVSEDRWLDLSNAALASTLHLAGDAGPRFPEPVDWDDVVLHVFARADR